MMNDEELINFLIREKEKIKDMYWNTSNIFEPIMDTLNCAITVLQNRVFTQEKEEEKAVNDGMFIVVEATEFYKVCYETITGVMYLMTNGGQNFTVMVDGEGKPLTYYRWRRAKNNRENK